MAVMPILALMGIKYAIMSGVIGTTVPAWLIAITFLLVCAIAIIPVARWAMRGVYKA